VSVAKNLKTIVRESLPLGTVVEDVNGVPWVFVGSAQTKTGRLRRYFRVAVSHQKKLPYADWMWEGVFESSLTKKFPHLVLVP
jgi:hypothetical protein